MVYRFRSIDISGSSDTISYKEIENRIEELKEELNVPSLTEQEEEELSTLREIPGLEDMTEEEAKEAGYSVQFSRLSVLIEKEEGDDRLMTEEEAKEAGKEEEFSQLKELESIEAEISRHTTLINEDSFESHIRSFYEEMHPELRNITGLVIDWKATAERSESDYNSVTFDGSTFYYQD